MPSVESVVVWSSMSRVTVAPTSSAAAQISRAWSSAIFSPSAPRACPIALSFTLTSVRAVSGPSRSVNSALCRSASSLR